MSMPTEALLPLILGSGSDVRKLSRQINDETTGLDTKAPVILETASGAIASFSDGADGMPIKSLVANIDPVQDLHGYNNPWPGGGNVNLLSTAQSKTQNGITFAVQSDGSINISGTATAASSIDVGRREFTLPAGTYRYEYNAGTISGVSTSVWADGSPASLLLTGTGVFTTAEETNPFVRIAVASGTTVNFTAWPMISAGSDAYAYSPYSNECPISGWTGAEIEQTGVNVWDEEWEVGAINGINGKNISNSNKIRSTNYIPIQPNTTYYFYHPPITGSSDLFMYKSDKTYLGNYGAQEAKSFTTPADAYFMRFSITGTTYENNISVNYPATATDYAPYTGNQISVNWEDEAGTVYGGTITLNPDRTGTLVADRAVLDDSNAGWRYSTNGNRWYSDALSGEIVAPANNNVVADAIAEAYKALSFNELTNDESKIGLAIFAPSRIFVRNGSSTEAPTGKIVAKLASPQTIQLTAEQVSGILSTLYGTNNIWSSTGDTEVTYPCDTRLYIDNKIAQAIANALNS